MEIFSQDLIGQSGGILISDYVNNERVILLGKSNIPKRENTYESFGGKTEKEDLSSLHTSVREMIEEFFNVKISTDDINQIAFDLRNNKLILKQNQFFGMSYLINFNGLNYIFQKLCLINNNFQKYNLNNYFDYKTYIQERIVNQEPNDGLNEIFQIKLFKINELDQVKLRWFTRKIISRML